MAFNYNELNKARRNWDPEREESEKTDPDYSASSEQKFLNELAQLPEEELKNALSFCSPRQRRKIEERVRRIQRGN